MESAILYIGEREQVNQ